MLIRVVTALPWEVEADALGLPLAAEETLEGELGALDQRVDGRLSALHAFGELSGKSGRTAIVPTALACGHLVAAGIGEADDADRRGAVRFGATVERRLGGRRVRRLAIWLRAPGGRAIDASTRAELVTRGVVEGSYEPAMIYRESVETAPPAIEELILVAPGAADPAALFAAAERGRIVGEGANTARTLANRAANDVSPAVLADEAAALAARHGIAVEVIDAARAAELGMGMFVAVGRGSDNPPCLIVLRSGDAPPGDGRLLALVGKGVTFDAGGISIKPAERMSEMKMDKAGAAAAIAAIVTANRLRPGIPLVAVVPAVENMPGPHSTRPGDVVRALNGKTVEIDNTDAEGRLILGDALTYAERLGATHLVDVATLTGAVERMLGKQVTGGFGAPQAWWDEVMVAGVRAGEPYWQLPLVDDYLPDMEGWYAELRNSGGPEASLARSGLFIRQFVTRPWVHLDIGGSAYLRRETPWSARGATGVTHATLVELALAGAPG